MTTKVNSEALEESKQKNNDLIIKPSTITGDDILNDESNTVLPGNGVFTKLDMFVGEYISFYTGWIISYADSTKLMEHNAHSHLITRNKMRDAIMGVESFEELSFFPENERGLGSFINHSARPNVEQVLIDGHIIFKCLIDLL